MIDSQLNHQVANHLVKALSHSAWIIFIFRLIFAVFFVLLHLWGLVAFSFVGAFVWLWIKKTSGKEYLRSAFILGFVEVFVFSVYSIAMLGWGSGVYFPSVIYFPIIMTNERLTNKMRISFSALLTVLLVALFVISSQLSWGRSIPPVYLNAALLLNLIEGCVLLAMFMYTLESEKRSSEAEIVTANQQLLALANTDPLTSLLNRRNMMVRIEEEKNKMDKGGLAFSLIMIDVDNFKQINDEYGHDCGDFVLVMMAEKIRFGVRKNDLICRWGGDEFLILLAETDLMSCQVVAEKVRMRVINSPFIYHDIDIPVTITLGMSQCDKNSGVGACIRKADLALYKGKQEGKNRSILMN